MKRELLVLAIFCTTLVEAGEVVGRQSGEDLTQWQCRAAGERCGFGVGAPICCSGQCCSGGRCKVCDNPVVDEAAAPAAGLLGELLTDFAGRQFTFPGVVGEAYSLFTEADHQVNAVLYPEEGLSRELGVTLRGVGVHGPDTSVRIAVDEQSQLAVEINERPFRGRQMRLDGVTATAGCLRSRCGDQQDDAAAFTVSDSFMTLWAWTNPGHAAELNFRISLAGRPLSQVHGILGQALEGVLLGAAPSTLLALPPDQRFYGEGQPADYSTTDLFSGDSTFSVFARKLGRRRHRRKRSMLEGNALAALALASRQGGPARQRLQPRTGS